MFVIDTMRPSKKQVSFTYQRSVHLESKYQSLHLHPKRTKIFCISAALALFNVSNKKNKANYYTAC